MSQVDGSYDCVTKSPMGDQKSVFTVTSSGDSFTGQNAGAMGSLDVENGKVDGNKLTWTMNMKVPMPMTLECEATIDGDALTGSIKAGAFGSMAMTGTPFLSASTVPCRRVVISTSIRAMSASTSLGLRSPAEF